MLFKKLPLSKAQLNRFNWMKCVAEKINYFLDKGYLIFDEYGNAIKQDRRFAIDNEKFFITFNTVVYFGFNDPEPPIKEMKKYFKYWKILPPNQAKDLIKFIEEE